jgi:hypothetical protein
MAAPDLSLERLAGPERGAGGINVASAGAQVDGERLALALSSST